MPRDRFFNLKIMKESIDPQGEAYSGSGEGGKEFAGESESPLLDIYEEADAIVIEADLPGIDPQQIAVRLANNQVIIEGRRADRGEGIQAGRYLRMERCIEAFRRVIPIPIAVDPHRTEASYQNGVLNLRLPRIEDRRNRTIKIQIK